MRSVACVASRVRFAKCMILRNNNFAKSSKCNAVQRSCNAKDKNVSALLRVHLSLGKCNAQHRDMSGATLVNLCMLENHHSGDIK